MSEVLTGKICFDLINAFTRALSHRIRTPLSVISNDLFCFQSRLGQEECSRSVARCRDIASVLTDACAAGQEPLLLEVLRLGEILKEVFDGRLNGLAGFAAVAVRGDRKRLKFALQAVRDLGGEEGWEEQICRIEKSRGEWVIELSNALMVERQHQGLFHALSHYFNQELGSDSFLPIVADCILMAHAIKVRLNASETLQIELSGKICVEEPG